jgi:hypothetical protein
MSQGERRGLSGHLETPGAIDARMELPYSNLEIRSRHRRAGQVKLSRSIVWFLNIVIILTVTIFIFFTNQTIVYGNNGSCDPWYFFGIEYDYLNIKLWRSSDYQLYRYPAIFPWIAIGSYVSSTTLHDLKFWTYLLVTSGCFSFASIVLFGSRIGSILSILFACSTLVLGTFSTDFVTGAGLAWQCAVIAATLHGASRQNLVPWGLATGALYAMCVFTHIPMAMFTFSVPLLFFSTTQHEHKMQAFAIYNMWGLIGFAVAAVLMGIYSLSIGNDFLFFMNEIKGAIVIVQLHAYERPITNNWTWFKTDTDIPLFFCAFGISTIYVGYALFRGQASNASRFLPPMLAYLLVATLCFSWEFSGRVVLQLGWFAPWMYPPAFLAIGSGLAMAKPMSWRLTLVVLAVASVLLVAAASHPDIGAPAQVRFAIAGLAICFCAPAFQRWSAAPAISSIVALICITYPYSNGGAPWQSRHGGEKAVYKSVRAAHAFVAAHATSEKPVFWISSDAQSYGSPSFAAAATPLTFLECGLFPASFPSVDRETAGLNSLFPDLRSAVASGYIKAGERLFVIAPGSRLAEDSAPPLTSVGLAGTLVAEQSIDNDISIAAIDLRSSE